MNNLQNYIILGVMASTLLEVIKMYADLSSTKGKLAILFFSIVAGVGYYYVSKDVNLYQTILGILGSASVAYNFLIKDTVGSLIKS